MMSAFRTTNASGFPMDIWSRKWYKPPAVPSGWNSCRYLYKNIYTVTNYLFLLSYYKCASVSGMLKEVWEALQNNTNFYRFLNGGESLSHPPYKCLWNFASLQSYIFISFWHTVTPCFTDDPLLQTPQYFGQFDLQSTLSSRTPL